MRLTLLFTLVLLVLPGCRRDAPEGVYPCTVASDCPAMWVCRADMRCWSRESVVDAGTDGGIASDGGLPSDTGVDAPMSDTGPHCGAEACNGSDDDCDGLIDEGVITVGPAVTATTTHDLLIGALVPTTAGFGIVQVSPDTLPAVSWLPLDASGAPGTVANVGSDVARYFTTDATHTGTTVLVAATDFTADQAALFGFDEVNGTRTVAATPFALSLPSGESPGVARFSQASTTRATVYLAHFPSTGSGALAIRRFRIDLSGTTPTGRDARDVVTDLDRSTAFAVLGTDTADYLVYRRTDGRIVLLAGTAGDGVAAFHMVGLIGDTTSPSMDYASLAIRDRTMAVSAANPLGIAWAGRNIGSGPRVTLAFSEATDTTVLAASAPISFPDAYGAWGSLLVFRTMTLLALPDASEHWILVNQDTNSAAAPTGAVLQVREIIGAGTNVRRIIVPAELLGPQQDISVAVAAAGHIRVAEASDTGGIITRSIGCE